MFTKDQKINVQFEEKVVNGFYIGNTSVFCQKLGLHEWVDMKGNLCLSALNTIEAGHEKKASKSVK